MAPPETNLEGPVQRRQVPQDQPQTEPENHRKLVPTQNLLRPRRLQNPLQLRLQTRKRGNQRSPAQKIPRKKQERKRRLHSRHHPTDFIDVHQHEIRVEFAHGDRAIRMFFRQNKRQEHFVRSHHSPLDLPVQNRREVQDRERFGADIEFEADSQIAGKHRAQRRNRPDLQRQLVLHLLHLEKDFRAVLRLDAVREERNHREPGQNHQFAEEVPENGADEQQKGVRKKAQRKVHGAGVLEHLQHGANAGERVLLQQNGRRAEAREKQHRKVPPALQGPGGRVPEPNRRGHRVGVHQRKRGRGSFEGHFDQEVPERAALFREEKQEVFGFLDDAVQPKQLFGSEGNSENLPVFDHRLWKRLL